MFNAYIQMNPPVFPVIPEYSYICFYIILSESSNILSRFEWLY